MEKEKKYGIYVVSGQIHRTCFYILQEDLDGKNQ